MFILYIKTGNFYGRIRNETNSFLKMWEILCTPKTSADYTFLKVPAPRFSSYPHADHYDLTRRNWKLEIIDY